MYTYVICPICKARCIMITNVHAQQHGFATKHDLYKEHGRPELRRDGPAPWIDTEVNKWIRENTVNISEYSFRPYLPAKRK